VRPKDGLVIAAKRGMHLAVQRMASNAGQCHTHECDESDATVRNALAHFDAEVGGRRALHEAQRRLAEGAKHGVQLPSPAPHVSGVPQRRRHACIMLGPRTHMFCHVSHWLDRAAERLAAAFAHCKPATACRG